MFFLYIKDTNSVLNVVVYFKVVTWYNIFMNPELPQVNRTPEVQPQNIGGGEYNVENTSLNPEVGRESEQSLGAGVEQYNNIPVALPVDNTTTVPLSQSQNDAQSTNQPGVVADDDTPLVAADEDLIEREWVDKS